SPSMAARCADDFVRTIEFIRGTHAAIADIRKQYPARPARVLYAGCGPYATLAAPLMAIFSPQEAAFTLLDIHSESIESAKCIAATLGLADRVARCETMDAALYRIDPDQPPDVILMEMMQACLKSEPQVAIARHLLLQAPRAILIPEEVRIDLVLVDLSREFALDDLEQNTGGIQRDRIPVAPVFVVNREAVHLWESIGGNRLPGLAARLPDPMQQRYRPMLFTNIRIYQDHVLKDYDSGLTCPRHFSSDMPIQAGDTIYFHYELGRQPRLKGEAGTQTA
ncbi:MAG: class I SAM-dependent methyltransferase, partial [Anaerolineales bacterium]